MLPTVGFIFGLSALFGLLTLSLAVPLGKRFGLVVRPRLFDEGGRKVTYLGGPALALAVIGSFLIISGASSKILPLLGGGLVLLILGFVDDRLTADGGIHPGVRLLVEGVVALAVWIAGYRPVQTGYFWLDAGITVLFLVAAANAFNLVDNMNGVSGVTGAAAAFGIAGAALLLGRPGAVILAAAVAGALLTFLPFNLGKASVYLGDSGSLFFGFVLGALALGLQPGLGGIQDLVFATSLMVVPFADTIARQVCRWTTGRSLRDVEGGTDHVSHGLVRLGFTTEHAAGIHGLAALLGGGGAIWSAVILRVEPAVVAISIVAAGAFAVSMASRKHVHRKAWPRVLAFGGAAALGSVLLAAFPVLKARAELLESKQKMTQGVNAARSLDSGIARQAFAEAEKLALRAQERLKSAPAQPVRLIPYVGNSVSTAERLASAGGILAGSAQKAVGSLEKLMPGGTSGLISNGKVALERWPEAAKDLEAAAAEVRLGSTQVRASGHWVIPSVARARSEFLDQALIAGKALDSASAAGELVPAMLGSNGPRTWFLAIQNEAELRATGGLIGAFGILRTDRGQITLERFESDRALPLLSKPVEAPGQIDHRYEGFESAKLWTNVNLSPDFPTVGRLVGDMWQQGTGQKIDGVLSIDVSGLAELMKVVGTVNIPEIDAQADPGNLGTLLLSTAYATIPGRNERQDLLAKVGRETVGKLLEGSVAPSNSLFTGLAKVIASKHLMVWSRQEQERLAQLGVGNRIAAEADKDQLLVVAQNAAASKMDYYLHRKVQYEVDLRNPEQTQGRVKVSLENRAPASGIPDYVMGSIVPRGDNRSYLSVYLGSAAVVHDAFLNGVESGAESHVERGRPVASHFIDEANGKASVFEFRTGRRALALKAYHVEIAKQPGVHPDSLRLSIRLPAGAVVEDSSKGMRQVGNKVVWEGKLTSDREFFVRYSTSTVDRMKSWLVRAL